MIKLLTLTTLYPNKVVPRHGIFVENRIRNLVDTDEVSSKVIAPVPWFPFKNEIFGEYSNFASVPKSENRCGINIQHPRYYLIPKIGMNTAPHFLAQAMLKAAREIIKNGYDFDVIDAHYFYPDGVAAVKVGQILKKPVVITARGTDLNLIPQYPKPRQMIKWAADHASAIITVCQALKDVLLEMGIPDKKVRVLRNGVDLNMFYPASNRDILRKKLKIEGRTILSVGHLIKRKGHGLIIEALKTLPDVKLLIAGDGEDMGRLKQLAQSNGVRDRVTFLGAVEHEKMKDYYAAADALVLASSREGWANVLLESMACGTPVVATNIWGTPEVVAVPEAGLLTERSALGISNSIKKLFDSYPSRNSTRRYAENFSWDQTTEGQLDIFRKLLNKVMV